MTLPTRTAQKKSFFRIPGGFASALYMAALFCVLSCASSAGRADRYGGLGQGGDPVPFMEAVRTGTLPNGLRYYILENAKPANRAYLTLAVNAGSILEKDDERGLAHFVEHMAFNGTRRFPESELVNYLRSLGMRFGPEVNAYTSYDETVYGIEVPTEAGDGGLKRIPDRALAVIDDWTHAITFAPKDVDEERLVIMEEYRARLGAGERVQRKMLPVIFQGSPYADRLPIGLPEVIQNAPASRLEAFYKTWYRADNMALILVGDFDGAALEVELASHFSAPAPEGPLNRPVYELPPPKRGNLSVDIITDPEQPFTRLDLFYKQPPLPLRGDLASYRAGLIDNLINQILGFRFDEASSDPESPYAAAGAGSARFGAASRYYVLSAIAKPGSTRETIVELLREKESVSRYGFTEAEIDRAKRSLVSALERMVSEKDRLESDRYLSEFTGHFLNNQNVADIEWELDAVTRLLPGISPRDMAAAAKDYFAADDLRVLVAAPEGEAFPPAEEIRLLVAESKRARIPRPDPAPAALEDALLDEPPVPGFITAEAVDGETGALLWELSNGGRVILKETQNKNNEIILYALARGGTAGVPAAEDVSASLAAEMLAASGLGPYSRPELMQKLAGKQVALSFWASSYYRGFQGSATTGDIKTLFEMLYLNLTDPRLDDGAVAAMLDQYRASLAQRGEDPEEVFSDEISRIIYGGHPHFKALELADLPRADTGQAAQFLREALNPADYTFVFTGNLDMAAMRAYTEAYLASAPTGELSRNAWTDLGIVRPGRTESRVFKGKEERSLVFLGWYAPAPYSEEASVVTSVLNEYLDILLTEEIREKLGGVYSVSAGASISPIPAGELVLGVYFACDPQRAAELSAAIEEQFRALAAGTVEGDTFEKAREALKKTWENSIQSNSYIAQSYANSAALLDAPLSRLDKRPGLYDAVIPADLWKTMAQVLKNGPVRIILYPEGWQ
jgi:zinc protease